MARLLPLLVVLTAATSSTVTALPLVPLDLNPSSLVSNHPPLAVLPRANQIFDTPMLETLGLAHSSGTVTPASSAAAPHQHATKKSSVPLLRRVTDDQTAGGNAHTGNTGDVDSGNINNIAGSDSTITNMGGNNVPQAGQTVSGDARGGRGRNLGPGGNASSGNTGTANGGYVNNDAGVVNNMGPGNNAGDGGLSQSGEATGGVSYKV
ncbi:hypothetical protein BXZ70DRAFT_937888 [Cristinia sonorae]|uniref:Period circadian protein n=1 Tax=Cristinia sonorae TaxID=1940300 RepID=A0A8K0UNF4_9AGAR|nr:hypothetical protein BXZ70DRAFT_937888 [Cristinia sonorae]